MFIVKRQVYVNGNPNKAFYVLVISHEKIHCFCKNEVKDKIDDNIYYIKKQTHGTLLSIL